MSSQLLRLVGHVGKDAEVHQFPDGNFVISWSLAVTEKWTNKAGEKQTKTTWFRCNYYRPTDKIAAFIKKGDLLEVNGKPMATAYTKGGDTMISLECKVDTIDFLNSANGKTGFAPPPQPEGPPSPGNQDDDDLPF